MLLLLGFELRTLYLDRDEHDLAQSLANCRQLESFKIIAQSIKDGVISSKEQYDSTITHVQGVLKTTQRISTLSQRNLENISGGDSFACVYPSKPTRGNQLVTLNVHNYGAQILLGVVVTVYLLPDGPLPQNANGYQQFQAVPATNIGSLAPNEGRLVPGSVFVPQLGTDGIAHYHVYVNSQAPGIDEQLDFKPTTDGMKWVWRLTAGRKVEGKPRRSDIYIPEKKIWVRILKKTEWSES